MMIAAGKSDFRTTDVRASFEPRPRRNPTDSHLVRKPDLAVGRSIASKPGGPLNATTNRNACRQVLNQIDLRTRPVFPRPNAT
jgi:hypothetical protein